ncbi:Putative major facilitator superfamily, MFS transporter superfamily [Septoria linicola]|uniref:Major facilitator superfamily, MFS transporter superfamily n=1 Tax=Septoria linicola TaxID=215465 RepID=A0A9Q9ARN7_9PEZI|nr:Putative major facilitator superfamily, MFS transporter superfamily [Septoria linicola]
MATTYDAARVDPNTSSGDVTPIRDKAELTHIEKAEISSIDALYIDPEKQRKLVRKIDWHVLPLVMLLYLNSFIDRVNIGNARLYGLERDLGMQGNQFQIAVSVLFVTYVIFELPSNLVMKKYVRPSRWIASITMGWGLVATFSGFTQSYAGLIICRLLLGTTEAGLFPGMVVYLTFFYTKHELALRTAYLFVSAAVAGSVGGLLAYGIGFMDGLGGYSGWRWILIIEGIPTIILAVVSWFYLADDANNAYFLNQEERDLVTLRQKAQTGVTEEFDWADSKKALKDWKTYLFAVSQFVNACMLYSYSTFLPTIILQIMPSAGRAITQLLTMPCYAVGAIVYLCLAWLSDKKQIRGPIAASCGAVSVIGYGILLSNAPAGVLYFGCCVVAAGIYIALGLNIAWLNTNNPRYGKRTTASGTQIMLGNIAGTVAPFLYPTEDRPRFTKGHATNLAMVALGVCIFTFFHLYFSWENKQRRLGKRDHKMEGKTEEEILAMGDENPRFMYTT